MQIRLHIRSSHIPNLVMTYTIDTSDRSRVEAGVQDVVIHVHLAKTVLATGWRLMNNGVVLERWTVQHRL